MALFALSPLLVLTATALVVWAINDRVRSFIQGLITLGGLVIALGLVIAAQALVARGQGALIGDGAFVWGALNDQPLELRFAITQLPGFFSLILLLGGIVTAGGLAWTLGQATRAFGLVFAGLLLLLAGGLLTFTSVATLGALGGLGLAWLGGTIMQQATTAHNREATFGGLALLLLALALLSFGATPQLTGGQITAWLWLAGCAVLIGVTPRWGMTPTAPLLVRAPALALGLPTLGCYLLLRYATAAAASWSLQTTFLVLLLGALLLLIATINALTARRFGSATSWQLVAQLALIVLVFGTGQEAAGPIAAGLLAHTIVTGVSIALAVGQLERATRSDEFATLPPLPRPLRRAGLAYGLAAISCAGMPPLLGYALRRVVLTLARATPTQPWLPPFVLACSTLLALSYLPTLVAFFRRPAFRSPLTVLEQRGGGWPLALMCGVLIGGLVPDQIWQLVLGDPTVTSVTLPTPELLLRTAVVAVVTLALFGLVNRALRHPRPEAPFMGGEPLDEEPGWTLPFAGLRAILRPLALPEERLGRTLGQTIEQQRERLTGLRQALERRYYLAVVVISLISVLLLATQ
jgi:formate hydrogenlyase subunit 3/multisubunit Na+/H+ antiporter MnhD subunit